MTLTTDYVFWTFNLNECLTDVLEQIKNKLRDMLKILYACNSLYISCIIRFRKNVLYKSYILEKGRVNNLYDITSVIFYIQRNKLSAISFTIWVFYKHVGPLADNFFKAYIMACLHFTYTNILVHVSGAIRLDPALLTWLPFHNILHGLDNVMY